MNKSHRCRRSIKIVAVVSCRWERHARAQSKVQLYLGFPHRQLTTTSYLRRLCNVMRLIRASSFGLKLITSGSSFNVL
jgi:hypothetical protein